MATFKQLFAQQIKELQNAKIKTYLNIDRNKIRKIAEEQALNILDLHQDEKDLWDAYYNAEMQGASPEREAELKDFDEIAKGNKAVKFSKLRNDNYEWFRNALGKPKSQYEIGHKDVSIALTRAKIILDNAKRGTGTGEINPTQVRIIEKIIKALTKVDRLDEKAINKLKSETKLTTTGRLGKEALFAMLDSTEEVEVNQRFLSQAGSDFADLTYNIEFEANNINQAKGTLSSILGNLLGKVISTNSEKISMKKLNEDAFVRKLMTSKASPSLIENIKGFLTAGFFGKKYTRRKSRASSNYKRKYKPIVAVNSLRKKYLARKLKKLPKVKDKPIPAVSLFAMRDLINEVLSERIKQLMGKATDPAVKLRYQTGRFAESAMLLTLTRTEAGILAGTWTYQKSPYEVFAPGHPLDNGSRDPAIYIEGAIRGAAMSILKKKFPGITLEDK